MATRSAIGYELPDGSIRAVYCHWGGSPTNQLPILWKHYNAVAKVKKLIAPGSMSSLRTAETWTEETRDPQPLYHKERGDDGPWNYGGGHYSMPAVTTDSPSATYTHWKDHGCQWIYIYRPKIREWVFYYLYDDP